MLVNLFKTTFSLTLMSIAFWGNAQWVPVDFSSSQHVLRFKHSSANKIWGYGGANLDINFFTSNDGGNTFEYQTSPIFRRVLHFDCINDSTAYFMGSPSTGGFDKVFKTTDSGIHWDTISSPPAIFQNGVLVTFIAFDALHLCLISPHKVNGCPEIWVSQNGGNLWNQVSCDSVFGTPDDRFPSFIVLNK